MGCFRFITQATDCATRALGCLFLIICLLLFVVMCGRL